MNKFRVDAVRLERFQEKWTRFSVRKRDQTRKREHFHESINLGNALRAIPKEISGTTAIEFAIILPLFLSFLLGTIEVAQAVYSQGIMRYAIQEASRTIMVDSNLSASQVETAVTDKLDGLSAADILSVTVTLVDNLDMTETLTLEVSYKYDFEVPLVTTIPLTFDSKTQVLREMAPAA